MLPAKKYLKAYQESMRVSIPEDLQKELLAEYGQPAVDDEGRVYEYTEQDISEQLKKRLR